MTHAAPTILALLRRGGLHLCEALAVIAAVAATQASSGAEFASRESRDKIEFSHSKQLFGGLPAVTLHRQRTGDGSKPEFLSVTVLPGRGMDVFQITADLPGRGETALLESPSLEEASMIFGGPDDEFGNQTFHMGAAFLIPFANRVLGDLPTDDRPVTAQWGRTTLHLTANFPSTAPDIRHYAIHGMLSNEQVAHYSQRSVRDGGAIEGIFHCGDFHGHWPSRTDVDIRVSLTGSEVLLSVRASNVGKEAEPMGIGSHPYFRIISGMRSRVRLQVPASSRAEVNNYSDVFPTGRVVPVEGTAYDLRAPSGVALEGLLLDDNWIDLKRDTSGSATTVLVDPGAHLGLRIAALSPEIKAIQVYAPAGKNFVAVEDQFNLNDPFGKEWEGRATGMVELSPGHSVVWKQSLQLFVP
jgi:galactose mutarotase-like enzyme